MTDISFFQPDGSLIVVTAVMPCLDEERSVGICIDKAIEAFNRLGIAGEVIVADNGSSDRSVEIAQARGARVVHVTRRGYGAALEAGVRAAKGRVIVMGDADDSYDWSTVGDFVAAIDAGNDLVVGNRFRGGIEPGAMPPLHRYLGNPVLSWLTRRMYDIPIDDFHCGMRAFTREAFARMRLRTTGMEFATEMVVSAAHQGLRICEIPTRLYPDRRDRPPHLRSFRDGWRHLRFMLTHAPDWLYLLPGSLFSALGATGMISMANGPLEIGGMQFGIHFLALSSLFALLGANVLGFGLLARLTQIPRKPVVEHSALAWLLAAFTLERGLLVGGVLFFGGFAIDGVIFVEWVSRNYGEMADTVRLAFIASTVMVLGVNILFGAFLLSMLREEIFNRP